MAWYQKGAWKIEFGRYHKEFKSQESSLEEHLSHRGTQKTAQREERKRKTRSFIKKARRVISYGILCQQRSILILQWKLKNNDRKDEWAQLSGGWNWKQTHSNQQEERIKKKV